MQIEKLSSVQSFGNYQHKCNIVSNAPNVKIDNKSESKLLMSLNGLANMSKNAVQFKGLNKSETAKPQVTTYLSPEGRRIAKVITEGDKTTLIDYSVDGKKIKSKSVTVGNVKETKFFNYDGQLICEEKEVKDSRKIKKIRVVYSEDGHSKMLEEWETYKP